MGNRTHLNQSATDPSGTVTLYFDLPFQGREMIKSVLHQLALGVTYTDTSCNQESTNTNNDCVLPSLESADTVLFTGASGGGLALQYGVDDLVEEVRSI